MLITPDAQAAAIAAVHAGDAESLARILDENADLHEARADGQRTLLHTATDWPGHRPNTAAVIGTLVAHGADVNAPFVGTHSETALHWAASSDDLEALDALLDCGANIEAPGGVIGGGTPMADAVAFGCFKAARRLVERGARTNLWQAAALGLVGCLEQYFASDPMPSPDEVTNAFWSACHGGQKGSAEYLLDRGADVNWIGYDNLTPLDAANRSGAGELVDWLRARGAKTAGEI